MILERNPNPYTQKELDEIRRLFNWPEKRTDMLASRMLDTIDLLQQELQTLRRLIPTSKIKAGKRKSAES